MSMGSPVLFLTNSELGQASICLAVAHELLLRPSYTVHIASFAPLRDAVSQLNSRAVAFLSSSAATLRKATFHRISGLSMRQALEQRRNFYPTDAFQLHGLGYHAASQAYRDVLARALAPWTGEEYMAIIRDCVEILRRVQPALIVVDPLFAQAADACRQLGKKYVILSPNTFKEHVAQPRLGNLWKYPMPCSGYPYPLPWRLILPNSLLALRMVATLKTSPQVKEVEKHRKANGLLGSIPDMVIKPNDRNVLAVLLPSQPEYEYPCFVPPEFTLCGPIVRPCAPIANEHPELARWIAQHPTVLVNLGSIAQFSPAMEREFAKALRLVLEVRGEAQVLWKLPRPTSSTSSSGVITDPLALELLSYYMAEGRLRTVTWLPVEPICLLQSGHIQCVLHHGGANAYHEAIRAGVPQVIAPIWFDTFDFAQRVEYLGIGYWGNRIHAPALHGPELGQAVKRVLFTGRGRNIKHSAQEMAAKLGDKEGRVVACEKLMELIPKSVGKLD